MDDARFPAAPWAMGLAGAFAASAATTLVADASAAAGFPGAWWTAGILLGLALFATAPLMVAGAFWSVAGEDVDAARVHAGMTTALCLVMWCSLPGEGIWRGDHTTNSILALLVACTLAQAALANVAARMGASECGRDAGTHLAFAGPATAIFGGWLAATLAS